MKFFNKMNFFKNNIYLIKKIIFFMNFTIGKIVTKLTLEKKHLKEEESRMKEL